MEQEKQQQKQGQDMIRWIALVLNLFAGLFLLLAVYYIVWSLWNQENYSSIIVYSIALSLSFITVQQILHNRKTFVIFAVAAVIFCMLGIFHINVTSMFY